ncbi:histidine triad domain-containing protein [Cystoisospora suis]|uniref:Histidine triad domain-containing protein n=1 Tax=Cystoisospora suis TaxID=483139 RepID=A0A2C6KRN2_9APIC|nr:histidine triad domain-containing protein [Cystoisospora suis]
MECAPAFPASPTERPCSASLWQLLATCTRGLRANLSSSSSCCWPGPFSFAGVNLSPENVIFSSELSFAMLSPHPVLPGHAIVTPRRHVKALFDLSDDEREDLFLVTQATSYALNGVTGTDGCTLLVQQGEAAEQHVSQLYVHLVPRRKDDLPSNDEIYPLLESSPVLPDPDGREAATDGVCGGPLKERVAGFAVREWMLQLAADKTAPPCADSHQ